MSICMVVGWLTIFMCHLKKEKAGNLFQIIPTANPFISKSVTEIPDLMYDSVGDHISL
jgi:hypothetical protein